MNKQNLYTVLGIALSFIIAVGGWTLTSALIDRKSDALLSATESVKFNMQATIEQGDEETHHNFPTLSEGEIAKIILSWESIIEERPHEPVEGQLNMEQAIEAGKAGLSYFYEQDIISGELLEYAKTSAYLCEKQPSGQENHTLNPYYSYWTVTFSSENKRATLVIHAMTGQIWQAVVSGDIESSLETAKLLDVFIAYLNLDANGSFVSDGHITSKSFAGGSLHAIARRGTATTSLSESGSSGFFRLYLSAQSPIRE